MEYLLPSATVTETTTRDGRSSRWDEHRAQRRIELVDAAIRAIRAHGPGVGMEDIAATAGTSKTVVYRHFSDRAGLYAAVAERVEGLILRDLGKALAGSGDTEVVPPGSEVIRALVDSYLRLVERDPEVYRFIVATPAEGSALPDAAGDITSRVVREVIGHLEAALGEEGRTRIRGEVWATGVVGTVRAAADAWAARTGGFAGLGREELTDELAALLWSGLAPLWPRP